MRLHHPGQEFPGTISKIYSYIIPEKPRSKNPKYRITQNGENLLNL
jgi:hypothetical protein